MLNIFIQIAVPYWGIIPQYGASIHERITADMKFIGYDGEIELIDGAVNIRKGKKDAGRTIRLSDITTSSGRKGISERRS